MKDKETRNSCRILLNHLLPIPEKRLGGEGFFALHRLEDFVGEGVGNSRTTETYLKFVQSTLSLFDEEDGLVIGEPRTGITLGTPEFVQLKKAISDMLSHQRGEIEAQSFDLAAHKVAQVLNRIYVITPRS